MNYIDLHQDLASARFFPQLAEQTDFAKLEKAAAKIVIGSGFTLPEEKLKGVISRDFAFYNEYCASNPHWKMIRKQSDVRDIITTQNTHGILFHIEGFPGIQEDWPLLEGWYAQGLRSVGLVWNENNPLGGGTNSDVGLTKFGRRFIAWCEEKNILIDLAHANRTLFQECLTIATRSPFISHGALDSIASSRRNFTDLQIQTVANRGGIFGIFFAQGFLTKTDMTRMNDVVRHITAGISIAGEDAIALGTDFGGMIDGTPQELTSVLDMKKLWDALKMQGFSEIQIEKIAYKNAARYLQETLPS